LRNAAADADFARIGHGATALKADGSMLPHHAVHAALAEMLALKKDSHVC